MTKELKTLKTEDEIINTTDEEFSVKYNSDAHEILHNYFKPIVYEMVEYGSWYDKHLEVKKNPESNQYYQFYYLANKDGEESGDDILVKKVYPKQVTTTIYVDKEKL